MSRDSRSVVLACLLTAAAPLASAQQQQSLGIRDTDGAGAFVQQKDRRVNLICPAITEPRTQVWGTDTYAYESSICSAAIHAGVLPLGQAGMVSIVMGYSPDGFTGTVRNGVTSASYPNGGYSYTFSKSTEPAAIDWRTNAQGVPPEYTKPITVICPGGHKPDGFIWGTNTYTADSSICTAAVHVGLITPPASGVVTVTRVPGVDEYPKTTQFGVTSIYWSAWADAFRLSPGSAGPVDTTTETGRLIRTAGYTGTGTGADIVPRTIAVAGFTGQGTGADIVPRTIQTKGWTGSGAAP